MVTFRAPLNTARLVLRPLLATDLDDVHAYQRLPEVTRFMLWEVRTLEQSREHLERRVAMTSLDADGDVLVVAVVLGAGEASAGRLIGEITVFLHSTANRQAEIGWAFHPDFQGRGYAREAASRMLDWAFTVLPAHRVSAQLDPRNTASSGLAVWLGMRLEAHFCEDIHFKGAWGDTAVYAILRREWLARQPGQVGQVAQGAQGAQVAQGTIRVAALVLVRERRMLMVTARGRDVLYLPGGKIDHGETAVDAVRRESREEIAVELEPQSIRELFTVTTQAHGEPAGRLVAMTLFSASTPDDPRASAEVDSLHWVTSADRLRCPPAGIEALDRLLALGLID